VQGPGSAIDLGLDTSCEEVAAEPRSKSDRKDRSKKTSKSMSSRTATTRSAGSIGGFYGVFDGVMEHNLDGSDDRAHNSSVSPYHKRQSRHPKRHPLQTVHNHFNFSGAPQQESVEAAIQVLESQGLLVSNVGCRSSRDTHVESYHLGSRDEGTSKSYFDDHSSDSASRDQGRSKSLSGESHAWTACNDGGNDGKQDPWCGWSLPPSAHGQANAQAWGDQAKVVSQHGRSEVHKGQQEHHNRTAGGAEMDYDTWKRIQAANNRDMRQATSRVRHRSPSGRFRLEPMRGTPDEPLVKPYWGDWNIDKKGYGAAARGKVDSVFHSNHPRDPYIAEAYDMPSICSQYAAANGLQVQTKTGKGARYCHRTARPTYLDTMESPYAVFTFKYRTKDVLEKILTTNVEESKESAKARIKAMSRSELERELLSLEVRIPFRVAIHPVDADVFEQSRTRPSHHHAMQAGQAPRSRQSAQRSVTSNDNPAVEKTVMGWDDGNKSRAVSVVKGWAVKNDTREGMPSLEVAAVSDPILTYPTSGNATSREKIAVQNGFVARGTPVPSVGEKSAGKQFQWVESDRGSGGGGGGGGGGDVVSNHW